MGSLFFPDIVLSVLTLPFVLVEVAIEIMGVNGLFRCDIRNILLRRDDSMDIQFGTMDDNNIVTPV